MCPPERNALKEFYEAAKGGDWANSAGWLNPYANVCTWFGVTCKDDRVVGLNLTGNGLAGTLSEKIADLASLEVLDLSDNGIGCVFP